MKMNEKVRMHTFLILLAIFCFFANISTSLGTPPRPDHSASFRNVIGRGLNGIFLGGLAYSGYLHSISPASIIPGTCVGLLIAGYSTFDQIDEPKIIKNTHIKRLGDEESSFLALGSDCKLLGTRVTPEVANPGDQVIVELTYEAFPADAPLQGKIAVDRNSVNSHLIYKTGHDTTINLYPDFYFSRFDLYTRGRYFVQKAILIPESAQPGEYRITASIARKGFMRKPQVISEPMMLTIQSSDAPKKK